MVVIVQGQKMACQPCIRGHRSTKCTHSDSRMLLAVNKPGRPLSSCPHLTPHLNCDCRRVVAAFPRKRTKCPCPPGDKPPSAVAQPPSPTKHTFKVDKSITSTTSRPLSRRPTLDNYADRIDTSHVNVIPAPQYRPQLPIAPALVSGFPVNGQFVGYIQPHMPSQAPNPMMWNGMNGQFSNGVPVQFDANNMPPNLGAFATKPGFMNGDGGVNGFMNGNGNGMGHDIMYQYTPTHTKMDSGVSGIGVPMDVPGLSAPGSMSSSESPIAPLGPGTPQFSPQDAFQYNSMQSMQAPIPFFALPSTYGAPEKSIPAPQWQQIATFSQVESPAMAPNGFTYTAKPDMGLSTQEKGPSCTCGDGCNCLGCEMHLHNRRTTQYVEKAAREQWDDNKIKTMRSDYTSPPASNTSPSSGLEDDIVVDDIDYLFTEFTFPCAGDKNSCQCAEGCECDGCKTHEGIQCWGEEGTCPCGPECSCIGCTVHGNDKEKEVKKEELENGNLASFDSDEEDELPKRSCCQ